MPLYNILIIIIDSDLQQIFFVHNGPPRPVASKHVTNCPKRLWSSTPWEDMDDQ